MDASIQQFTAPLFLAAPIVILVLKAICRRRATGFVPFPSVEAISETKPTLRIQLMRPILAACSVVSVLALGIAAARPETIHSVSDQRKRRNIILAIDVSRSMTTPDFWLGLRRASRLTAVKSVVAAFLDARKDDRIGLVAFGTNAFLQAPLTLDHELLKTLVDALEPGVAGDGTAIGDGIGLALKRMQSFPKESRAVILMTDGVSNSGSVNPLQAAKIAQELGVKIHTIGVGSTSTASLSGDAGADFDEASLKEIAKMTGGVYFNAQTTENLQKVYDEINKLEGTTAEDPKHEVVDERFIPWALAAFIAYGSYIVFSHSIFLRVP